MPDTADIVVRGVWDDDRGHQLSGVLVEGRYFIEDVRNRTRVRSQVLRNLIQHLNAAKIPFATQRMRITSQEDNS